MALTVYNGAPGSGKSYEVVLSVIVPAVKAGRRVLTNIDGISSENVRQFCVQEYASDLAKLGTIVSVTQGQIASSMFFPHVIDSKIVPGDYVVSPGDIVCIDEGYKFWKNKLIESHLVFFREHRHFAHPDTGYTCDIVIMTQSFGDIHRDARSIVEQSYITHKAKAIRDNLYTIKQFDGNRQLKATFIQDWTRTYDPKIFPLYKSYFGGAGKEVSVDARQKFFSKKIIVKVVMLLGFAGGCLYYFYSSWHDKVHPDQKTPPGQTPGGGANSTGISPQSAATVPRRIVVDPRVPSADLRIVGTFVSGGRRTVILANSAGRLRFESADSFTGEGANESGAFDGANVNRFSGQIPVSNSGSTKP